MIPIDTPLDRLMAGTRSCLGATFLSYTFDPTFFEEEVLSTLLGIMSDPEEAPRAFINEATHKLQQVPVTVMVDPGHLQGGKRLPYDLLPARRERIFHPKLTLILYKDLAPADGRLRKPDHRRLRGQRRDRRRPDPWIPRGRGAHPGRDWLPRSLPAPR